MDLYAFARARVARFGWTLGVYLPPDRRILTRTILPHYAQASAFPRVLFVGVKEYTAGYRALFAPGVLVTMDPDPMQAKYGAAEHHVARAEEVAALLPAASVSAILMNGVIGYGMNTKEQVGAAFEAFRQVLRPGGHVVLGVNEKKPTHVPLEGVDALDAFEPCAIEPLSQSRIEVSVPFPEKTHTFLFYRKR